MIKPKVVSNAKEIMRELKGIYDKKHQELKFYEKMSDIFRKAAIVYEQNMQKERELRE